MTMEVKLSAEQSELVQSVRGLLQRYRSASAPVGPAEADLGASQALQTAGYTDVISAGGSAVDAVLVIEEAAASAPGAPVAARTLVGPLVTNAELPLVLALAERPAGAISRFAQLSDAFLVLAGDEALLAGKESTDVVPVASRWGYPVARVSVSGGEPLGPDSGSALLTSWRIALAAETGGLMEAATLHASRYVTVRHQFGKPIGALQSIQHRLARAYVLSQGTKWLARKAAWDLTDPVAAAAAACYGAAGIREVISTTQQVCGAIGITDEFGLTAYTARLAMLQTELGGSIAHARALAHLRWDERAAAAGAQSGRSTTTSALAPSR
jgi:Acyl-CoA dehydrogenase, C-terminal domain